MNNTKSDEITLDYSLDQFKSLLQKATDLILDTFSNLDRRKVFEKKSPDEISKLFDKTLPVDPITHDKLWDIVENKIVANATFSSGPNFYSYVLSPGNQVGLAGDMISTFLNQNTSKWHLGPAAAEIEKITLRWVAEFIGYTNYSGGIFVSGGSMANLTCLNVARNVKSAVDVNQQGLFQQAPLRVYLTDQAHYCVDKAISILGLGRQNIQRIPTHENLQMDIKALQTAIVDDRKAGFQPFCVVGSAGTVNTGTIDPMNAIADVCNEHKLWFHIDAAYGGPAAALSSQKEAFAGLHRADSIALDPHKWLYVPIEAGCALFKNREALRQTYSLVPEYLRVDRSVDMSRTDFMEFGPQLTRSFRALKVWMTFKAFGIKKLKSAIAHDITKAQYLKELINTSEDFEVRGPVELSIVCFRFNPKGSKLSEEELDELNIRLLHSLEEDATVFITGTSIHESAALRVCIVNHRTQIRHIDKLMDTVKKMGEKVYQRK